MIDVFSLILLIGILYGFGFLLLQCDFEDRIAWFLIIIFGLPAFSIIMPKFPIFKSLYDIYEYLTTSSAVSYLSTHRSLFMIILLTLSFICCYCVNKTIISDTQNVSVSSRIISLSRALGYSGACSILLFSPFFRYVSLHPDEKLISYGIFKLYLDICSILLLAVILFFISYLFANLFIYFSDISNFSSDSHYEYVFRQCFWYCYPHKRLYWDIKQYLSNNLVTIKDIHIKFHVSNNIAKSIKVGKLDESKPYNKSYVNKKGSNNVNFITRMLHNHYIKKKTDNEIIRRAKLLIDGGSLKYDDKKGSLNNKINNDAKTLTLNQLYKIEHKYNSKIKN